MTESLFKSKRGVTIVGAGEAAQSEIIQALKLAPVLVAADGGAKMAMQAGYIPDAVIGDLDSLSEAVRSRLPESSLYVIREQDSTDFDKCLRSVEAPRFISVGVTAPRLDHGLATLNTLARYPRKRALLFTGHDVVFLAPPRIELRLPLGTRVSLFALAAVGGRSRGLKWSIEGIVFAPDGRVGTSNRASDNIVILEFDNPGMLLILPSECLGEVASALDRSSLWTGD